MDANQTQQTQTLDAVQGQAEAHPMQDILPEIKKLAEKVGGMKRLAEIVEALDQSKAE